MYFFCYFTYIFFFKVFFSFFFKFFKYLRFFDYKKLKKIGLNFKFDDSFFFNKLSLLFSKLSLNKKRF
jgi:hypothetical protein